MSYVCTGIERLAADPGLLHGDRVGLITNPTGVLPDLCPPPAHPEAWLDGGPLLYR